MKSHPFHGWEITDKTPILSPWGRLGLVLDYYAEPEEADGAEQEDEEAEAEEEHQDEAE